MKKIKILILIVAVLIVGVASQLLLNPSVKTTEVRVVSWMSAYDAISADAEEVDKGNNLGEYNHVVSYDGELPSDNPEDYATIYVKHKAKNWSYLQNATVSAYLEDVGKYKENVLFTTDSDGILPLLLYNGYEGEGYIVLDVYTGNLDESQIKELVRSVTVRIEIDKEFTGSAEKMLDYSDVDNIEIVKYEDED